MKLAINAIPYTRWSGIEIFLYNLLNNWPLNTSDEVVLFTNSKSSKLFANLPKHIKIQEIKINNNRLNLFLYQQIIFPFILIRNNFDILFCSSLITPWLFLKKITTIHDAAPFVLKNENSTAGKLFWRINLFFSLLTSSKIITVSNFSKDELVNKLKIKSEKIEIIYNGHPSIKDQSMNKNEYEKYLVTVGNARPRKNLTILFNAFDILQKTDNQIKLKIIGKMDNQMKALKDTYNRANIIFTDFINDEEKFRIINQAQALIFPSIYEGFGIPILEANILKIPVICSDIPAFKEVASSSALYFNPYNAQELANQIKLVLNSKEVANSLSNKGYTNAQRFNWQESAKKLANIVKQTYENYSNK